MIGKSLIHYEITAEIGKGGMGEVYQAKDTKLGRDVAIKVLPEEFAMDHDRVARFQREAKLLASLNHPNIAAIHGLEESEGIHFLVMELIEGDTLRDRIKSGPIPVEEALKLALQMAEALEAAHENGVIHRDLKPSNIKVTPEGKVKILDFGLAKAYVGDQENLSPMDSPTISAAATQQGVILGTAAYMSPEQAKGKPVDKRADIWAFGCVLFEILTGKSLFSGEDVTSTVARVLEREPDFSTLPQKLHPRIRLLLERCLKKDPRNRYSGISDARVDIQEVLADPSSIFAQPISTAEPHRNIRPILASIAAAVILTALIVGAVIWNLRTPESRQVMRSVYELPEDQQITDDPHANIAVSPDGSKIVYSANNGLFLRSMSEWHARRISDENENAVSPFFSPDGKWVGYQSTLDMKLKKVAINNLGARVTLCDFTNMLSASWNADNTIIYMDMGKGIMRIPEKGGTPETLIKTEDAFFHPRLLPDGETILFTLLTDEGYKVALQSLKTEKRKILFAGDSAWYLPNGQIVYARDNSLYAVPFDFHTLQENGSHVLLVEGLYRASGQGSPQYAVSVSGTLVYVPESATSFTTGRTLVWVDKEGSEEPLEFAADAYKNPKISPDGKQVAVGIKKDGIENIWIGNIASGIMTRLTREIYDVDHPLWTPDGQQIVFTLNKGRGIRIYKTRAGVTGEVEELGPLTSATNYYPYSWAGNLNTLILTFWQNGYDIGMLRMEDDIIFKPLLNEKYYEDCPDVSPDGQWIAYASNENEWNQTEVFVRPFPDVNKSKTQVSENGGTYPLWSPDGKELFYRNDDAIIAVSVETKPTFKSGKPKVLFHGAYVGPGANEGHPWHISRDGKRFLMIKLPQTNEKSTAEGPRKINIVLNWDEELKEKMPVD